MNTQYDIVIVGGGVTGLTLAALLAQSPAGRALQIRIVDGAPRPSPHVGDAIALRVSALSPGSVDLLEHLGAWAFVRDTRSCAYERMRVWDESMPPESTSTLRFDAAEFGVPSLGYIVENDLLREALMSILDSMPVEMNFAVTIATLEQDGTRSLLRLEDGRELQADLVIGADGVQSFVRQNAGIGAREWPYGQSAFVTHVRPEKPHRNTAWQRFLRTGPLALLPLPDGLVSVVWSTCRSTVDAAMQADDVPLGRMLSDASDYVLGALHPVSGRGAFPLCARHAQEYVRPGLALIGDAAHSIHPLAGQGANLGLADARALAEVLEAALKSGAHLADQPVLRRYERARKGANATMLHFMTGLNRLFATDFVLVRDLRKAGIQLFNKSGPVREHVVGIALGAGGR